MFEYFINENECKKKFKREQQKKKRKNEINRTFFLSIFLSLSNKCHIGISVNLYFISQQKSSLLEREKV